MENVDLIIWGGLGAFTLVAGLFFTGKIRGFKFSKGEGTFDLEIKGAKDESAPSSKISVGNIDRTGGDVKIGAGASSTKVGDIKETQGSVEIGDEKPIKKENPEK
ncbi:MAG: hypothetical protein COV66_01250 [Nitrospinae bacterium CG11_big_fil_rev_8_21_14_0_20_45_15]|nr:MAG: hypothetical protein COV66_01250 [Nitrospinae bacterium CG11_big_fil_rev_8_21_14_0_20_45_15]